MKLKIGGVEAIPYVTHESIYLEIIRLKFKVTGSQCVIKRCFFY